MKNFVKKISVAFAYISVWEIILGFGGDLISFGPIKIRAFLAVFNVFLLIVNIVIGSAKIKIHYLVLSSVILIASVNFLWTFYGLEMNNEFAIADGGGSLLSILSCLSIIISVLNIQSSKDTLFNLLQLPLLIFFSALSLLWITQPIHHIDLSLLLEPYTAVTIIGGGGDLGRYYFPSTVLLPLSAFIFAIYSPKFSVLKFYSYITLYIISVLAVGSRGVALGALSIIAVAFIIRILSLQNRPANLMIFLSPLLVATLILSPILAESLRSTRFFEPNAEYSQLASDDTRFQQAPLLLESFLEEPILGRGSGYYIDGFLRSNNQPYLYELYFLTLLMKTGILGSFLYFSALMAILITPFVSKFSYLLSVKILYVIAFVTTILQGSSNPFLDRPCGLLLLFGPWLAIELLRKLPVDYSIIRKPIRSKSQSQFTTQIMT